jgi:D-sedoheptulose 7-phosphate isomerase
MKDMKNDEIISLLCAEYPSLNSLKEDLARAAEMIIDCYEKGGKLLLCGNGGSSADADHLAAELMKSFETKRTLDSSLKKRLSEISVSRGDYLGEKLEHALPAISLVSNSALTSAISNDTGPALVFAQQIVGLGNEGDVLVAISTSGNSSNVVDACITAKALNLNIIGLTGESGGKMKEFCDVVLNVPEKKTARVQELHLPVIHALCRITENHFYNQ